MSINLHFLKAKCCANERTTYLDHGASEQSGGGNLTKHSSLSESKGIAHIYCAPLQAAWVLYSAIKLRRNIFLKVFNSQSETALKKWPLGPNTQNYLLWKLEWKFVIHQIPVISL